ncbi:MAG: hypothetical protein E4H20_01490, partial [Spirochaetales bacterium]
MASQTARGTVRLNVDELGLEVTLRFTPDPEGGADWTADSLGKIVSDARINSVSSRILSDAVGKFQEAKAPVSVIIAQGQAPSSGAPEEAKWLPLETPPEFIPFQAAVISEAPSPQLFRVRVERVTRERIVKKPGLLPFLPPKEEKVSETEKVERRDPVTLDGRVQRSFWAPADTCVAQLMAAKTGKPGKNIYGKVIPAIQDDDTAFYLGSGLEREKGEILTRAAGWVRVGTQWADLVPFAKHVFNLRISGDGTTLLLDFTPGDKRLPFPDVGTILQEAK